MAAWVSERNAAEPFLLIPGLWHPMPWKMPAWTPGTWNAARPASSNNLKSAGVKNGGKQQMAQFTRIDALPETDLHAEGYYDSAAGEQKAYLHLGPSSPRSPRRR